MIHIVSIEGGTLIKSQTEQPTPDELDAIRKDYPGGFMVTLIPDHGEIIGDTPVIDKTTQDFVIVRNFGEPSERKLQYRQKWGEFRIEYKDERGTVRFIDLATTAPRWLIQDIYTEFVTERGMSAAMLETAFYLDGIGFEVDKIEGSVIYAQQDDRAFRITPAEAPDHLPAAIAQLESLRRSMDYNDPDPEVDRLSYEGVMSELDAILRKLHQSV